MLLHHTPMLKKIMSSSSWLLSCCYCDPLGPKLEFGVVHLLLFLFVVAIVVLLLLQVLHYSTSLHYWLPSLLLPTSISLSLLSPYPSGPLVGSFHAVTLLLHILFFTKINGKIFPISHAIFISYDIVLPLHCRLKFYNHVTQLFLIDLP
jgi:hypothetical protein